MAYIENYYLCELRVEFFLTSQVTRSCTIQLRANKILRSINSQHFTVNRNGGFSSYYGHNNLNIKSEKLPLEFIIVSVYWTPLFVAVFPATNMRPQRGRTINYKGELWVEQKQTTGSCAWKTDRNFYWINILTLNSHYILKIRD